MKKFLLLMFAAAVLLPACDKGEDYTTETWIIASQMGAYIDGESGLPIPCYIGKTSEDQPWINFGNSIEGFEYVPGFEYTIRIRVYDIKNPPAGGSSARYVLDKVISKVEKDSEGLPGGGVPII